MASLLKGKQMAQRRLGLYRQVLQGHKSHTSIEVPGVRQIQSYAKTNGVPLLLAQCFCPSVINGCSGHGGSASAIPGNSQVWHRVRASWLYGSISLWQVKLYPRPVALASWEGETTWFSAAFLLLPTHTCRNVTSFLSSRMGGRVVAAVVPGFSHSLAFIAI